MNATDFGLIAMFVHSEAMGIAFKDVLSQIKENDHD